MKEMNDTIEFIATTTSLVVNLARLFKGLNFSNNL